LDKLEEKENTIIQRDLWKKGFVDDAFVLNQIVGRKKKVSKLKRIGDDIFDEPTVLVPPRSLTRK
jgi:hypothetical protein